MVIEVKLSKQNPRCFLSGSMDFETLGLDHNVSITHLICLNIVAFYANIKRVLASLLGIKVKTNFFLADGRCPVNRQIKEEAGSWKSLHVIYNHKFENFGRVTNFWLRCRNFQAVRNRFKIAESMLRTCIESFNSPTIRLVSLASGSAQNVFEVVKYYKDKGIIINVLLLDIDATAIDYSRDLAIKLGIIDQIEFKVTNVVRSGTIIKEFKPDIVEMMGLLDYLRENIAIGLMRKIRKALPGNGIFLTCHIHNNAEEYFMKWMVNWDNLLYRTPEKLEELIRKSGFNEVTLLTEPHGIHTIAVAQK